ncbi:reverse transcriptase [Corchorus capsularis]|uniref:Reverse transcriptase n=1 Tax=Corchorus capsularis TaxID=210143 RepID=A0A1R3G9W2_COCAP|nr:reverse transcriptase [Corchorus capsularis]
MMEWKNQKLCRSNSVLFGSGSLNYPPIMMTSKIGAVVAGVIGQVLEVDEQLGNFIRVRVKMDVTRPILDETTVTSPFGDYEVEFRYEDLPDICRVCGLFDHTSENDCLLATEMRKTQGSVTKKYTARIKPESPWFKSARFGDGDGSFRLGCMGSRQSSPLSISSGVPMPPGREGRSTQQSPSVGSQGRRFRNHVDSMLLRGRSVARPLFPGEVSCEVISRLPENNGGPVAGEVERSVERMVESVTQRGGLVESSADELYGDLNLSARIGEATKVVQQPQPKFGGDFFITESSSNSAARSVQQRRKGKGKQRISWASSTDSIGSSFGSIPGIGRMRRGQGRLGPDLMHLVSGLAAGPSAGPNLINQVNAAGLGENSNAYDPNSPFVFSAGVSIGARKIRTWKKHARASDKYTFEALSKSTAVKVGDKRNSVQPVRTRGVYIADTDAAAGGGGVTGVRGGGVSSSNADGNNGAKAGAGDFNEILSNDEKIGGAMRPQRQMNLFREVVDACGFHDIPVKGSLMTWSRRMGDEIVFERLDRYFATESWLEKFQFSFVQSLLTSVSDHLPLLVHVLERPELECRSRGQFRFEAMWLLHKDIDKVVEEGWNGVVSSDVQQRIRNCGKMLEDWNRRVFGNVKEEVMWRQRAKMSWLKEGDRNSRFFHSVATHRKRRNTIVSIQDEMGHWQTDCVSVENVIVKYYKDIFSSLHPTIHQIHQVTGLVDRRVSTSMSAMLDREFTREEVRVAVFDMEPNKSAGPDGMSPLFYQWFWNIVGEEVLANRLKEVLPHIIGPTQSAFIPGRMIFDSALIAFENVHYMNNKRSGSDYHMALKLDLSKAYDRAEWDFLEGIMRQMGFSDRWIGLVMVSVRTVTYSILINGIQSEKVVPTRRVRQGDSLSPYLFLLCMEGLSSMLQHAERVGDIRGISIARNALRVSHLFFADDSLLFVRTSLAECDAIMRILKVYELASGKFINIDKSAVLFSKNTPEDLRKAIQHHLGVQKILSRDKYLGMPIMIGKSKRAELEVIKDRLWKRIQSWSGRLLSIASKAVMIQAVAQVIPTYLMSCFKFPKSFLHELNMLIARFWWGSTDTKRKIHWKAWDDLCVSKLDGGLGFRDFEAFNLALLAKQCWRLIRNENSLCYRILWAKYFRNNTFMKAKLGHNPSFVWRSLLAGREVLRGGSRWRVGNGYEIDVWSDNWLNKPPTFKPQAQIGTICHATTISSLMDYPGHWDLDLLQELVVPEDVTRILCIPLSILPYRDTLIWNDTANGIYTIKSGYHVARRMLGKEVSSVDGRLSRWPIVWGASVLPKIKFFMWRLLHNILPRKDQLIRSVWELSCPWLMGYLYRWYGREDFWDCLLEKAAQLGSMEIVLTTMWRLWSNRNKSLHENVCSLPSTLCTSVARLLSEVGTAQRRFVEPRQQEGPSTWVPPCLANFKINTDAAYYFISQEAGLGVVIRDVDGIVLFTATARINSVPNALFAEVYAIRFGLILAYSYGLLSAEVESDSLQAVVELNRTDSSLWE